jgi:hypothetical protein
MPKTQRRLDRFQATHRRIIAGAAVLLGAVCHDGRSVVRAQTIPTDAQTTCTVPAATFASWFQSGTPALNGVVKPADSVAFPNIPNCSFYQWSKQMFLWLTSPAPATYGGGSRIFDSPTFYDVSPPDAAGNRTLQKHTPGIFHFLNVRATKPGPHMLPIIIDRAGRMFELQPPKLGPTGKPLILDGAGKEVEVANVTVEGNKVTFFGADKKPIVQPRLVPLRVEAVEKKAAAAKPAALAQKFIAGSKTIFVGAGGTVIDTEEGEADSTVLESQTHSLVYYTIMVNDVYAYFLTGAKDGAITPAPTQFPTTAAELAKIKTFASSHGTTFPDPNALAVEVKTAWVETTKLPSPDHYITVKAEVPKYNTSNPNKWVPTGKKTVTLALVSVHVVGSAAGHPEMIWATFEHTGDTPNAAFQYNSKTGPKTVAQSTAGKWLFSAPGSTGPFNKAHMMFKDATGDIVSVGSFKISPSDTLRMFPWGIAGTNAASNTEVIAIHDSVATQMPSGDVRNHYFMLGATWTPFGVPPTGGNGVGTNQLANTTLETYAQGTNCFDCHQGNMLGDPSGGLSHIYGLIKPLF